MFCLKLYLYPCTDSLKNFYQTLYALKQTLYKYSRKKLLDFYQPLLFNKKTIRETKLFFTAQMTDFLRTRDKKKTQWGLQRLLFQTNLLFGVQRDELVGEGGEVAEVEAVPHRQEHQHDELGEGARVEEPQPPVDVPATRLWRNNEPDRSLRRACWSKR